MRDVKRRGVLDLQAIVLHLLGFDHGRFTCRFQSWTTVSSMSAITWRRGFLL